MEKLNKAYEILDSIAQNADQDTIKKISQEAFDISKSCIEAAIVLSKLEDNFTLKESFLVDSLSHIIDELTINSEGRLILNLNRARYELGNLYYEYGMFSKAKTLYENLEQDKNNNYHVEYKLMSIYAFFEDENIDSYYKKHIANASIVDFVRISFPYLIYEYKKARFSKVIEIFNEIKFRNDEFIKVLKEEQGNNDKANEALRVLKNNAVLLNTCPYLIKYLLTL